MAATEARNATNEALYKVASTRASEALPKDQNLIETMTAKNRAVDRAIDNAIHEVAENTWRTTGGSYAGQAARANNLWDATARFKNLLSQIEANIGFDTLQEMRNNSKTGGALGNISDAEGAQLKSVFGSLTQEMSPPDMIKALTVVKNARIEAIVRLQEQHKRAVELNNAELSRLRPDLHPPKTDAEHSAAAAEAKQPLALPPSGEKSLVTEEQRRRYQK
jgi:hypothetical protein